MQIILKHIWKNYPKITKAFNKITKTKIIMKTENIKIKANLKY